MAWVWTIWLLSIAVSFAALETYAISHDHLTLSRYVWTISAKFPLFGFLCGLLVGGLAVHFWWGGIVSFNPVDWKHAD
jgi:hypothetical protein